MQLGLGQVASLLSALGDPQLGVPAILVAGTNGKGSVTAYASSILREQGLRTGSFFSPHLFRVNERIRIDGEEIPSPELDRIARRLRRMSGRTPFTFFEGLTAAAALWFRERGVEAAVWEVGLGGRLDATRLVDARVTAITGISVDHREHLGRTKLRILGEKLGIARPGAPLLANLGTAALRRSAGRRCAALGIELHDVGAEVSVSASRSRPDGIDVSLATPVREYGTVTLRMPGRVQAGNAATAVRAAELFLGGRSPSRTAVRAGLSRALIAGRFQVLPGNPRIVLDVSHNEEALLASLATLRDISPPQRTVLLFGVMARKEPGRFPRRAVRAAREIVLVTLRDEGSARGPDLARLFAAAGGGGRCVIRVARGMREGMRCALGRLGEGDTLLVLGSHMTVEEAVGCL